MLKISNKRDILFKNKVCKMTTRSRFAIFFIPVFLLLQLIRFDKTNPKVEPSKELVASTDVKNILKTSCYDRHSNESRWPWYSNISPVSWIIVEHVNDGRKWLNFSEWESYDEAKKQKLRKLIYREVSDAMPLLMYTVAHQGSSLNDNSRAVIRNWTGVKATDVSMRD